MIPSTYRDESYLMKLPEYEPWHEGEVKLRAIGETISLPKGIRFKYADQTHHDPTLDSTPQTNTRAFGEHRPSRREEGYDIVIDWCRNLRGILYKHVLGHEEGHLFSSTGNLQLLRESAKKEGFEFDCLNEQYAFDSDKAIRRIFNRNYKDEDLKFWVPPKNQRELLAHVGSLVALAKTQISPELTGELVAAIQTGREEKFKELMGNKFASSCFKTHRAPNSLFYILENRFRETAPALAMYQVRNTNINYF
ncbi:hypothetical protein HN832_02670 [archaeon]|jgi:hypothetical protein|nr:hypothetical protein [archaeon]MBT4373258.1 hypothetical protein [archaeon]MBT4531603.1 hypothetical protein [archaeon]MBT7001219.1 hypothetical protein [archaeon]MBT7282295.1 hypothetical protein [archaeon]